MAEQDEIKQLLAEIRDIQREFLVRQGEHLDIARQQLARSNSQVEESLQLQKEAVAKARLIGRVAIPGIIVCLVFIGYLIVKYF